MLNTVASCSSIWRVAARTRMRAAENFVYGGHAMPAHRCFNHPSKKTELVKELEGEVQTQDLHSEIVTKVIKRIQTIKPFDENHHLLNWANSSFKTIPLFDITTNKDYNEMKKLIQKGKMHMTI